MKVSELLPPADLLEKIEGVEEGLRQRRRLGRVGVLGVLVGTLQVVSAAYESEWWQAWTGLSGDMDLRQILAAWPLLVGLFVVVAAFCLMTWAFFWLEASQSAFRYSFWVADFVAVPPSNEVDPQLARLRHDLAERLSQRIGRLSLLETAPKPDPRTNDRQSSHIHISGEYVLRTDAHRQWVVEITPWIRVGPPGQPASLAHPVRLPLGPDDETHRDSDRSATSATGRAETPESSDASGDRAAPVWPPASHWGPDEYSQLIERLYFSVASEIYRQIRCDVQHKIALLPSDNFRAIAYIYEAKDYAASNTLDSYADAASLYLSAIRLLNPQRRTAPATFLGWTEHAFQRAVGRIYDWATPALSHVWAGLGQGTVRLARAETGYASMRLYQQFLALLSGQRAVSVFEARPIAADAVARLERLSRDVPGCRDALYDAYVMLALVLAFLHSRASAQRLIEKAQQLQPERTAGDPIFNFVLATLEPRIVGGLNFLRRTIELAPCFAVAQFCYAYWMELLWRTRATLERGAGNIALSEWERLCRSNPSLVGAWANQGYMYWLLGEPERAMKALRQGREYGEIKDGTFVSEVDYGIARILAERGDFEEAYFYYVNAVSGIVRNGSIYSEFRPYYYNRIGDAVMQRYHSYKETVERLFEDARRSGDAAGERIRRSVFAFVLNDYGEACYGYYSRFGDDRVLWEALFSFERARRINPNFVLPAYNLYEVSQNLDSRFAERYLDDLVGLERTWPVVHLAVLQTARLGRRSFGHPRATEDAVERLHYPDPNTLDDARCLQRLIPHAWLWPAEGPAPGAFQALLLTDPRMMRELKGEREFEALHVTALVTWAALWLRLHPGDDVADCRKRGEALAVFQYVAERFWEDDLATLRSCLDALSAKPGHGQDGLYRDRIARQVEKLFLSDRVLFTNLRHLNTNVLPEVRRRELLLLERKRAGRSKFFYAAIGDGLRQLGDLEEALASYALARTEPRPGWSIEPDSMPARLANQRFRFQGGANSAEAYWRLKRYAEGVRELQETDTSGPPVVGGWRTLVTDRLLTLDARPEARQAIQAWAQHGYERSSATGDGAGTRDTINALLRSARPDAGRLLEASPQAPEDRPPRAELPDALTFVVTLEESLLDRLRHNWDRLVGQLVSLRASIETQTGLLPPLIRLRSTPGLRQGGYRVSYEGLTIADGQVPVRRKLCLHTNRCRELEVKGQPDPYEPGLWLAPSNWPAATAHGLDLLDAADYLFLRLRSLLVRHLWTLISPALVRRLIQTWQAERVAWPKSRRTQVPAAVCEEMTWVISDLARSRVPVHNLKPLLDACRDSNWAKRDRDAKTAHVRTLLSRDLPGNEPGRRRVPVAVSLEDEIGRWVIGEPGRRALVMPSCEAHAVLAAFEPWIDDSCPDSLAIVVRQGWLRPFLAELLDERFSGVAVLAWHEVLPAYSIESDEISLA